MYMYIYIPYTVIALTSRSSLVCPLVSLQSPNRFPRKTVSKFQSYICFPFLSLAKKSNPLNNHGPSRDQKKDGLSALLVPHAGNPASPSGRPAAQSRARRRGASGPLGRGRRRTLDPRSVKVQWWTRAKKKTARHNLTDSDVVVMATHLSDTARHGPALLEADKCNGMRLLQFGCKTESTPNACAYLRP